MCKTVEELRNRAMEMLDNDDDLFCDMVDELDRWNGFADGYKCYNMCDIDDLCYGMTVSEFLDKLTGDFCKDDSYFYWSIYGLESTDDREGLYRSNVDTEELLDNIIDNYSHLWFSDNEFKDIIEEIIDFDGDFNY